MSRWRQRIVGDAFKLPSKDFNYYRDFLLLWPFLVFSIAGISQLSSHDSWRLGFELLALALITLSLAKERRLLVLGTLGISGVQFLLAFALKNDRRGLAGAAVTGIAFLLLARLWADYKPSYELPKGLTVADLLISLCSLAMSMAAFSLLQMR